MTDENKHPADGPEQEIKSDAAELLPAVSASDDATAHGLEEADGESSGLSATESPAEDEPLAAEEEEAPATRGALAAREAPAPKLERLQKILAQAGVASRRHAEEMITGGRIQVNGKIVTTLGSKADAARDHIRVDGKLLQGAERLRYFMLNKPRGFVTTVTDPEGRPTVMQFFAKENERLYPVGRLDYLSEGLLVITNDGELANQLTKAASGVEKTYLVKVAGQPAEEALDRLREGVSIDRGSPEQREKVRTAPARIRQVRKGDNPWYEVILIEGRNRELRKMFEEIGHHVEKIRRVGYGPLVLDVEPGKLRELQPEEVQALRLTAAGKLKPRRPKTTKLLPKDAGKTVSFEDKKRGGRGPVRDAEHQSKEDRQAYGGGRPSPSTDRAARPATDRPFRPADDRPARPSGTRTASDRSQRFEPGSRGRSPGPKMGRGSDRSPSRPGYPARGGEGYSARRPAGPGSHGPSTGRPGAGGPGAHRPGATRPDVSRPDRGRTGSYGPPADRRDEPRPSGGGFSKGPRGPERPFTGRRPDSGSPRPPQRSGFPTKPSFRAKPGFAAKPGFSAKPDFPKKPGFPAKPNFAAKKDFTDEPRPAGKIRLEITPEFDQPSRASEREAPARKPFPDRGSNPSRSSSRPPSRSFDRPASSGRRDSRPASPARDRGGFSDRPRSASPRPPRPTSPASQDGPPRTFRPASGRPSPGRPGSSRTGPGRSSSSGPGFRGKPSGGAKRGPGGGSGFRGKPAGGAKRSTGRPAGKRSSPVRGAKRPGGKGNSGKKRT